MKLLLHCQDVIERHFLKVTDQRQSGEMRLMRCTTSAEMENTVQSIANGNAVSSRVESTEDVTCKLSANGSASDSDRLDAKEDVKDFLDDDKAIADVEREERNEADEEMNWNCEEYKEPLEAFAGIDRGDSTTIKDSIWKLDRRASGHLFWRRDSSTLQDGVDPSSRVKFRFDVTVREYAEQQQESEHDDDSAEEQEVHDSGGFVLRQRKGLAATGETVEEVKSSTGMATSPVVIYSAVFLAIIMAAAIHWYLWGRTAWANLTGGRRGGSV